MVACKLVIYRHILELLTFANGNIPTYSISELFLDSLILTLDINLNSIESITHNPFYSMNPMEDLRSNYFVNRHMYHGMQRLNVCPLYVEYTDVPYTVV
jgi:hypothetical protein